MKTGKLSQLPLVVTALCAVLIMGCTQDSESEMDLSQDMGMNVDAQPAVPLPPSNDEFFRLDSILEIEIEMEIDGDQRDVHY